MASLRSVFFSLRALRYLASATTPLPNTPTTILHCLSSRRSLLYPRVTSTLPRYGDNAIQKYVNLHIGLLSTAQHHACCSRLPQWVAHAASRYRLFGTVVDAPQQARIARSPTRLSHPAERRHITP